MYEKGKNGQVQDDFIQIISGQSPFVDKSLFIRDFLDSGDCVQVITRPPGFGKSLNLSMLYHFLSINHKDDPNYFINLKIWQIGDRYRAKKGAFPVIYLSFKDCDAESMEAFYEYFKQLLASLYREYLPLLSETSLGTAYWKICLGSADKVDLMFSLEHLTRTLYEHYKIRPIVLIDDYDKAFWTAAIHGYYDAMQGILHPFFAAALKDNDYLDTSVLMGVSPLPAPTGFTGLNNVTHYDLFTARYDSHFGFSRQEVLDGFPALAADIDSIERDYGGYRTGNQVLFCPQFITRHTETTVHLVELHEHFILKKLGFLENKIRFFIDKLFESKMIDMVNEVWTHYERVNKAEFNDVINFLHQMGCLTARRENRSRGQCYIPNMVSFNVIKKIINNGLDHCSLITKHIPIMDGVFSLLDAKSAQSMACVSKNFHAGVIGRKNRFFSSEKVKTEAVFNSENPDAIPHCFSQFN